MKLIPLVNAALVATLVAGCAGTPPHGSAEYAEYKERQARTEAAKKTEKTLDKAPDWFLNPPVDGKYMYAVATDYSSELQFAIDKAVLNAKVGLAAQVGNRVSSSMKEFALEGGTGGEARVSREIERVSKEMVAEVNIAGFTIQKREILAQEGGYRVYVLARLPLADANKLVVAETKKNAFLDSRLRASKAFQELEKDIAASRKEEAKVLAAAAPAAAPAGADQSGGSGAAAVAVPEREQP